MKNYYLIFIFSAFLVPAYISYAADEKAKITGTHAHEEGETNEHSDEHSDHSKEEEEEHEHGKDEEGHKHAESEKESSSVGPEKGILAKSDDGFKLSPEAEKTIGISTIPVSNGSVRIHQKAIVKTKSEKSVFRLRDGWYKRVPIEFVSKESEFTVVKGSLLKSGDQVVSTNVGFLRMAEVFSEEGAEHSHAH